MVTVFLSKGANQRLMPKLLSEFRPGSEGGIIRLDLRLVDACFQRCGRQTVALCRPRPWLDLFPAFPRERYKGTDGSRTGVLLPRDLQ